METISTLYFDTVVTRDAYRNGFPDREDIIPFRKFRFTSTFHSMSIEIERDDYAYETEGTIVRIIPSDKLSNNLNAPFCCTIEELPNVLRDWAESALSWKLNK